ncbi:MAG: glutamate formimidoyltransferase [Gemmatimonadaceae bacterium]
MKLVECVPNFSEGRRPEVIEAIRAAIAAVDGVAMLDVSSDESHNRSVLTFVAPLGAAVEAAFAGIREARDRIDLTRHSGEHPRMGATDVVPFIPLEGTTMEDCIALARQLGERVGRELEIPVYLYERAATRPTRENLADLRRGQFEALLTEIGTVPEREPDFGPNRCHPTFGAVAIGARPFLVAYNVYLGPATNLPVAKKIAKAVRGSSGGFRFVKGLGLEVDGQAQVSMNLVDTTQTPVHRVFDFIEMEAQASGAPVTWSEIVGLVPERALFETAAHHLQLSDFTMDQVLEARVREHAAGGESITGFLGAVASSAPAPGGGSVAAHAGALAAALAQMVAALTIGKKKYASVESEMKELAIRAAALSNTLSALVKRDADAYTEVSSAYSLPKDTEADKAARDQAIQDALLKAADVPLETARACAEVEELALTAAERGNANAVSDAGVAALLAEAGCKAASYNVRINATSITDSAAAKRLNDQAAEIVRRVSEIAGKVSARVEAALTP